MATGDALRSHSISPIGWFRDGGWRAWLVGWAWRLRRRRPETMSDRERGLAGEHQAVRRLIADGCRILARNRRIAGVEIDVLAFDPKEGLMLVVEVKASGDGRPHERRVDATRRRRLRRAAVRLGMHHVVAVEVLAVDLRRASPCPTRRIRLEPSDLDSRRGQRFR